MEDADGSVQEERGTWEQRDRGNVSDQLAHGSNMAQVKFLRFCCMLRFYQHLFVM